MSADRSGPTDRPPTLPVILSEQLASLAPELRDLVMQLAEELKRPPAVADLWKLGEVTSYWVLLISGTNRSDHLQIARELLTWSAIATKGASRVVCVQNSDTAHFNLCAKHFGVTEYPSLYLGTSPEMITYVGLPKSVLQPLCSKEGALDDFLTEVHTALVKGESLSDINNRLLKDKALRFAGIAYREIRSIVSLNVKADLFGK